MPTEDYLPFHEPAILTILITTSFLLLLNGVSFILDKAIYCGLLGQIFIGVAWGAPGAALLSTATQESIVQLGYLGLILLVYEGGLSASIPALKANLWLSSVTALLGIGAPIGVSYVLIRLANASPLQAFAAGAALCSTSLGTTFTILSTSGLHTSRLGVVLTSAAMLDDVVGLVMLQVISNLGGSSSSFTASTVIRPVFVSLAFAVFTPLLCLFVFKPLARILSGSCSNTHLLRAYHWHGTVFVTNTTILLSFVTAASYAGTSNLFAAYLAGAVISWWDEESARSAEAHSTKAHLEDVKTTVKLGSEKSLSPGIESEFNSRSGKAIYKRMYATPVNTILKPFFFASIGFSIPISRMFSGSVIWRGLVYSLLMAFSKLICGLTLVQPLFTLLLRSSTLNSNVETNNNNGHASSKCPLGTYPKADPAPISRPKDDSNPDSSELFQPENVPTRTPSPDPNRIARATNTIKSIPKDVASDLKPTPHPPPSTIKPKQAKSLYPSLLLGSAMIARGEIGFLISAVAQASGVFNSRAGRPDSDELFLIITWAIMLCTIGGPLAVGLLVRRVRRVQTRAREGDEGCAEDPLGGWGIL
ncbi:MAG: hypothetical protein M1814_003145 [Vezdaea aestivalis]|nr:MAG: hypothetical protein M1814_003145 [Vezdaea aestivalis]